MSRRTSKPKPKARAAAKSTSRTTAPSRDIQAVSFSAIQEADRFIRALRPQAIKASFDAAQNSDENYKHWLEADHLSANAALSPTVRSTIRIRARYECANNCYAGGMVQTIADDVVGTGPRLQLRTKDAVLNKTIEQAWHKWCCATNLNGKLLTMQMARVTDGEAWAVMTNNPGIEGPIQLDVRLVESDRVTTPAMQLMDPLKEVDGIKFDEWGNPISYSILKYHPGDLYARAFETDVIAAENVLHLFRPTRPGQSRGVSEITAALPLFALLRRFTLAVLGAAETAANLAGVLHTDSPAGGEADVAAPFEPIDIERRAMLTLPSGWKMAQFRAEQPTSTYEMFKVEILKEAARILKMPFNIVAGDSSKYNYASGRLDHIVYARAIKLRRAETARMVLEPIFEEFMDELVLLDGVLPASMRTLDAECPRHEWMWPGNDVIDPDTEARANGTQLANFTTSYQRVYAEQGLDWEEQFDQIKEEQAKLKDYGLAAPIVPGSQPVGPTGAAPASPAAKQSGKPAAKQTAAAEEGNDNED